jgi:hypothetical protein
MEEGFEKLIGFTLKKEAVAGRVRVIFPKADQWKKFAKEKNELSLQYELLLKKSSRLSGEGREREKEKRTDYSKFFTISIKEPKYRFATPEAKEKFPHMSDLCQMNCGVDMVILMNPHELSALSREKQNEAVVQELLHFQEYRSGKFLSADQIVEKAKKIVAKFLKQAR